MLRELTCEDCQNGLMRFSLAITDEVNIVDLITYMQGDAYCTSGMEVPDCTELPDCMCPNVVEGILPPIMEVLSAALMDDPPAVCKSIFGETFC